MRQEVAQTTANGSGSGSHDSQADMANLSSYLAAMAIVVGLIIAWVSLCGI